MTPDLFSKAAAEDPSTGFEQLRSLGTVAQVRMPLVGKVFITTTHEATAAMLKDNTRFTMRRRGSRAVTGLQWWMPKSIRLLAQNMLTSDEPDHRRLRKLVDQAFQRRTVGELEPGIESTAKDLVGDLKSKIVQTGSADLVSGFARPLPLRVICDMLGLRSDMRNQFAQHAAQMTGISGTVGFVKALWPLRQMRLLLEEIVHDAQQRTQNGENVPGLIGALVQAEADGDRLSHDELIAMIFLLLVAGHETTTHLISGSVWALVRNPDQKDWLAEDETRFDLGVEELLRFVSPVQFSKPRTVSRAGTFFDADLKEGDLIMGGLAVANMDPVHFEQPEQLDLSRHPNPHLEFGTGIHFCLGFQLARLELKTALRVLMNEMPTFRFGGPEPEWHGRMGLRALKHLHIVEA